KPIAAADWGRMTAFRGSMALQRPWRLSCGVRRGGGAAVEEQGFVQQIRERPYDEALQLMFADRLEERGDTRADFLRLECDLRRMNQGEPSYPTALARWLDGRERLPSGWLDSLGCRVNGLLLPQTLADLLATRRWGSRSNRYPLPSA